MVVAIKEDITDQTFKAVEGKDDRLVFSEVHIKFIIAQTTWVNFRASEFQQVNNIDEADLEVR